MPGVRPQAPPWHHADSMFERIPTTRPGRLRCCRCAAGPPMCPAHATPKKTAHPNNASINMAPPTFAIVALLLLQIGIAEVAKASGGKEAEAVALAAGQHTDQPVTGLDIGGLPGAHLPSFDGGDD